MKKETYLVWRWYLQSEHHWYHANLFHCNIANHLRFRWVDYHCSMDLGCQLLNFPTIQTFQPSNYQSHCYCTTKWPFRHFGGPNKACRFLCPLGGSRFLQWHLEVFVLLHGWKASSLRDIHLKFNGIQSSMSFIKMKMRTKTFLSHFLGVAIT